MRVAFCHDNVYRTDAAAQVRSEGQFDSQCWERYLRVFDEVDVVGREKPLEDGDDAQRFNLSERNLVKFHFLPDLASPVRALSRRRQAREKLAKVIDSVDAVILRGSGEIAHMGEALAREMNKPIAVEVVGCTWDALWNYGSIQGKLFAPINYWRMKRMIARAPFAIYVSNHFLQQRYPCAGHTAVASNVEIEKPSDEVRERRLERISTDSDQYIVGMIGSLKHRYKGVHIALRALAKVRKEIPNCELRILGNGDPAQWIEMARKLGVSDITRFCGTLPSGAPVLDWLDTIDLYIQPSFQEGVPRALIEAMSRACPALGSTAGGIGELIHKDCLHKPGDTEKLETQMINAAKDKKWQEAAAVNNFEVAQRYVADVLSARRYAFWKAFADYAYSAKGNT